MWALTDSNRRPSACTEDAMDKVNKNPNNPQDAPAKFLITDLGVSTAFSTVGGDFSLYSSVYMEHEAGIGNQLYRAEVRSGEPTTATTYNNAWISVYANIKNAKIVINKCQEDSQNPPGLQRRGSSRCVRRHSFQRNRNFESGRYADVYAA